MSDSKLRNILYRMETEVYIERNVKIFIDIFRFVQLCITIPQHSKVRINHNGEHPIALMSN
jgi:hypothetical protein